ncbi:hypothetical protein EYF80_055941 [Liparis tanakae]|uniref:Uncharacterized protein n=1 Tax=Liparis tanakae TaxID=230148 RepID=A0A4Z2EY50_9TELE|nr:hypothetical protein EYF80_055941 [Liparis tanakae]
MERCARASKHVPADLRDSSTPLLSSSSVPLLRSSSTTLLLCSSVPLFLNSSTPLLLCSSPPLLLCSSDAWSCVLFFFSARELETEELRREKTQNSPIEFDPLLPVHRRNGPVLLRLLALRSLDAADLEGTEEEDGDREKKDARTAEETCGGGDQDGILYSTPARQEKKILKDERRAAGVSSVTERFYHDSTSRENNAPLCGGRPLTSPEETLRCILGYIRF